MSRSSVARYHDVTVSKLGFPKLGPMNQSTATRQVMIATVAGVTRSIVKAATKVVRSRSDGG